MRAGALTGSLCSSAKGVEVRPTKKKPPEGGFFFRKQKITSSRGLREQQVRRERPVRQEPKRQQQVPEPEPVREQRQEREREPVRALSCHMQPAQQQQQQLPERETCSFFDSLMNEKNIFHFLENPELSAPDLR